jgi:hypothetical protein
MPFNYIMQIKIPAAMMYKEDAELVQHLQKLNKIPGKVDYSSLEFVNLYCETRHADIGRLLREDTDNAETKDMFTIEHIDKERTKKHTIILIV